MWHQTEIWSKVIFFINEKQCFRHFYNKIRAGGEGGSDTINGVEMVCKQHSKNNAYSKSVIFCFYKRKIPFFPFV